MVFEVRGGFRGVPSFWLFLCHPGPAGISSHLVHFASLFTSIARVSPKGSGALPGSGLSRCRQSELVGLFGDFILNQIAQACYIHSASNRLPDINLLMCVQ